MICRTDHRDAAFTLAEVMLVLLIAALLAALTLPTLGRRTTDRERAAAVKLAAMLRDARIAALTRGRVYLVVLTADGDRYVATAYVVDADGRRQQVHDDRWAAPVWTPAVAVFDNDADVSPLIGPDEWAVVFAPSGAAGDCRIELEGGPERSFHINVRAPGGLVTLRCGRPDSPADTQTAAMEAYWETHCRKATP